MITEIWKKKFDFWGAASIQSQLLKRIGLINFLSYRNPLNKIATIRLNNCNIAVRKKTHDLEVALSCFEGEFSAAIECLPRDYSGTIIDAGGYIGTAAIVFARAFPQATIISIEPAKNNLEILKKNVARFKNIKVVEAALVGVESQRKTYLFERSTGEWGYTLLDETSSLTDTAPNKEIALCSTITPEGLGIAGSDVGLIKIDIEGGEYDLFQHCAQWLSQVGALVIELHDRIRPGCLHQFERFSKDRLVTKIGSEKFLSIKVAN